MTRYQAGTYSHTVERIVFADGSSARTDLIRLNPGFAGYSLDFTGVAPHHPSRYELADWTALPRLAARDAGRGREAEVDWILRHSFPMRTTSQLSDQLRTSGYPLGAAHISEHEAIAGTQAAIWYFTNGLALDNRPLNLPVAVRRGPGAAITFEFDGDPQLGGYSVRTTAGATLQLRLQKSTDGIDWHDVSGSSLNIEASGDGDIGERRHQRKLGVGSTTSTSRHGSAGRGYRYYRLMADTVAGAAAIEHVDFALTGTRHYRNADRVVHLYNYLLAGAQKARYGVTEPGLITAEARAEGDLVGPFQVRTSTQLRAVDGDEMIDADGFALAGPILPGTDFYLRRRLGTTGTTLTATPTAQAGDSAVGKVLTGVPLEDAEWPFTPVALAIPTEVVIEFDIDWSDDRDAEVSEFIG